ncbi:dephospho-CoA kinase-domain-containing protein [Chytriomyces sp. MP71]|nr:dephospho-CoA kinase-domain-containing protein [Chytriomyces sp. MP71]
MRIIGLTGGIATGKSTVSAMLEKAEFPIVDADVIAREVVEPGTPGHRRIVAAFGNGVLVNEADATSAIDRSKLAARVFSDADARSKINAATHPYIRLEMLRQLLGHFLRGRSAVILDTPLLFEAGIAKWVHLIIVVYVPPLVQRDRLITRNLITTTAANQRIDSQMPIDKKCDQAHIVIDNSGNVEETRALVKSIVPRLRPSKVYSLAVWAVLLWPAAVAWTGLSVIKWLKL